MTKKSKKSNLPIVQKGKNETLGKGKFAKSFDVMDSFAGKLAQAKSFKYLLKTGLSLVPGAGGVDALIDDYYKRRVDMGREVLLEEIKHSQKNIDDIVVNDEILAIISRYTNAILQGKAERNLRLLSRVILNQLEKGKFDRDDFDKYANIIESLTKEEIEVLGIYYKHYKGFRERNLTEIDNAALSQTVKELKPLGFRSGRYIKAILTSLQRNGIMIPSQASIGPPFLLSEIGIDLCQIALLHNENET